MTGVVYTETTIYAPAREFVNEAPYQLIIVTLDSGKRVTGRVEGDAVRIDDPVQQAGERNGVPFFRKI
jgi:uncharacterized OB-fold protein